MRLVVFLALVSLAPALRAQAAGEGQLHRASALDQPASSPHRNLVLKPRKQVFDCNLLTTQLGVGMAVCCGTSIMPGGCLFVPLTVSYAITKISDANAPLRGAVNWAAATGYVGAISVFASMLFVSNLIGAQQVRVPNDLAQPMVFFGFASMGTAAVLGSIAGYYIFAEPKASFDTGIGGPGYSKPFHQNGNRHLGKLFEIEAPEDNIAY